MSPAYLEGIHSLPAYFFVRINKRGWAWRFIRNDRMTSSSQPQAIQWDCLLKEHGRGLLLFARQYCHCLSDAEDLVQEGMMRALKRFESAHATDDPVATMSPEHLVAYLYTCVRRASWIRFAPQNDAKFVSHASKSFMNLWPISSPI